MKPGIFEKAVMRCLILLIAFFNFCNMQLQAQILCPPPGDMLFGMTNLGSIHQINPVTGVTGARINPAFTGINPAYQSNAMGYNPVNGRLYYFKRNALGTDPPEEFMIYNPLTNLNTLGPASPSNVLINLGACPAGGAGFYCIDAYGILYYYRISTNSWITICSNIRNTAGVSLATIINKGASLGPSSRIYGDMAFDGSGNLHLLISGPGDFGLYQINAPVPTAGVANLTINQILPPTTPSPEGQTIGGIAFTTTGQLYISTNSGNNKLYRMETNYSVTYLTTMDRDAIGTDLTSCGFPMYVLPDAWKGFAASIKTANNIALSWSIVEQPDTRAYHVEHSIDGQHWEEVAAIIPKGDNGEIENYQFNHNTSANGKHFYRIVRVDIDNALSFSPTRMINSYNSVSLSVYPNPVQELLQFEISNVTYTLNSRVRIIDQTGKMVLEQRMETGVNKVNIKSLSPGHYIISLQMPNGEKLTQTFLKS